MTIKQQPVIAVDQLSKVYTLGQEKVVALNNISLSIQPGEICSIFGTSGSGKSTLLNQLAGLEKPTSGSIKLLGAPIARLSEQSLARFRQKHLGFVFQSYNLLPYLNATENVALPLMFRGLTLEKRTRLAQTMLGRVGLGDRLNHYPNQMSGGQQQRVGLARAFITQPALVLADEPTGNLDSKTTEQVMTMIIQLARQLHQTIVLVTHDPAMAAYTDRIISLVDGQIISDSKGEKVC